MSKMRAGSARHRFTDGRRGVAGDDARGLARQPGHGARPVAGRGRRTPPPALPRQVRAVALWHIQIDGAEPHAELGWVGREVRIGTLRLRAARRTRRCAAIDVNPITAQRDTRLVMAIQRAFGHPDLGVYLEVVEDGLIAVGDSVGVEGGAGFRPDPPHA